MLPIAQILSGVAPVALFQRANLFQILLFLTIYIDSTLFGMIVLTSTAFINSKTKAVLHGVKGRVDRDKGYWRRFQKSCRPLRLEFGDNFVDILTPLVIQEYCVRQTASMLILVRV